MGADSAGWLKVGPEEEVGERAPRGTACGYRVSAGNGVEEKTTKGDYLMESS